MFNEASRFDWPAKYCGPERLQTLLWQLPKPWVFTSGVFDLLHRGHVSYLAEARRLGASLIVALHSDASVRMLMREAGQPVNRDVDRAWVVAALESVSLVTSFHESSPVALLTRIRPEVYVRGGDDDMAQRAEARVMHGWGGRCVALPRLEGYSASDVIDRIEHSETPSRRMTPPSASRWR